MNETKVTRRDPFVVLRRNTQLTQKITKGHRISKCFLLRNGQTVDIHATMLMLETVVSICVKLCQQFLLLIKWI